MMKRISMHSNPNTAWLIGILEGEGCFSYDRTQRVFVGSTDKDVIDRVISIVEGILGIEIKMQFREHPTGKGKNVQPQYIMQISGERARIIMGLILPFMSDRRRQRIWQSLNEHNASAYRNLNLVKLLRIGEVA